MVFSPERYFTSVEIPFAKGWGAGLVSFLYKSWDNLVSPVSFKKKKAVLGPSVHDKRAGFGIAHKGSVDCSLRFTILAFNRLPNPVPTSPVYILGVENSGSLKYSL